MTEWEKENERRAFEKAASIYAPLSTSISDRFKSSSAILVPPTIKDGLNDLSVVSSMMTSHYSYF